MCKNYKISKIYVRQYYEINQKSYDFNFIYL